MIEIPFPYKALIFDLDGTLADTMPLHYEACQIVCNKKGFDFPYDFFLSEAGRPTLEVFRDLVNKLDLKIDADQLGQEKEECFLDILDRVTPLKIVSDIVDANVNKVPMAIGSGGQKKSVDLTLRAIGYSNSFDAVVSCDDVKFPKPHPETFLKAANIMGVNPQECIVFEDGDPGIKAAEAAGMKWIDVRTYF